VLPQPKSRYFSRAIDGKTLTWPARRNLRAAPLQNRRLPLLGSAICSIPARGDSGIFTVLAAAKGLKRACLAPIGALR
jgi:hypothetical protein